MKYTTFSKLKAYRKALDLSKQINKILVFIPDNHQSDLKTRIVSSANNSAQSIKTAWIHGKELNDFIKHMGEVIVSNSEMFDILEEIKMYGFIDGNYYEKYFVEYNELRCLQLQIINNAKTYFEEGKAPDCWFVD